MKIVFKGSNAVKMYGGQITFQALFNFVKENWPQLSTFHMSFEDEDGDSVMVANQVDVDTMKQMYAGKEIIRLDIKGEPSDVSQKEIPLEKQQSPILASNEPQPKNKKEKRCHKRSSSKHEKSRQCKNRKMRHHGHHERFSEMIEEKISKAVEEKIYSLMPCFVNQVHNCSEGGLQKIVSNDQLVHDGVFCSGCGCIPIKGIRYACLQCLKFNLCQICEEKIVHEHHLLKMRKAQVLKFDQKSIDKRKCSRKIKRSSSSSSSSSSSPSSKEKECHKKRKGRHGKHHNRNKFEQKRQGCKWKRQKDLENLTPEQLSERILRISQKMARKFGGTSDQYKKYVSERGNKGFWEIFKEYCAENNIQRKNLRKRSSSSSSSSSLSSKQKKYRGKRHHSKHHHKGWKKHQKNSSSSQKNSEQKCNRKEQRRTEKLSNKMADKLGGNSEDYKKFVSQRTSKRFWEILKQYCAENNIQRQGKKKQCDPEKRKNIKLRKLALYFNKEQNQFEKVVSQNPDANFRQLLKIIKEEGAFDFDPKDENAISKMKSRFRRQKQQVQSWIKSSRLAQSKPLQKIEEKQEQNPIEKKEEKHEEKEVEKNQKLEQNKEIPEQKKENNGEEKKQSQVKNESFFEIVKPNPAEIRQKGRILIEMKEIFGEDKTKELFKFIEANFSLGQEKIIEKWLESEFDRNKK